jgi:PAS domain S-box-containing protein
LKARIRGVLKRVRLAWKMNGLFFAILVFVLGISAYVTNLDMERAELAAARELSRATSDRIRANVREVMLTGRPTELRSTVRRIASGNPNYRDIRLVSHPGQMDAASGEGVPGTIPTEAWPCSACHGESPVLDPRSGDACCDRVLEYPDGERVVSVVTPLYRESGCTNATCHTPNEAPVLGVIQADFSLARVDELMAQRNRHTLLVILALLVIGTVATWWMTERLIGRRIRSLREGAQRLAAHDYSFRFSDSAEDGIGELVHVFDSVTSELSETLSELVSAREYLQAIVENSADIIITVDPTGIITTFNPGAEKILGYEREEVVGRRIEMLFADPAERDAAIAKLDHSDHVVNYLTHFVTKKGDVRNVLLTLSRLRSPDGEPIGTMGISKDVTRELRLQRRLLRSERMAALGHAITGIQHSIKNLLNNMKGGAYMVRLGLKKDDRGLLMEGWEMVQEGIDDMTQMSMSMLDFARTRKLKLEKTDLKELATKAKATAEKRFKEEGVSLETELDSHVPPVMCDAEMVRSVILDLLENAVEACTWKEYPEGERPEVVLGLHNSDVSGYVKLHVTDNGEGITREVQKRMFTPFFSTKEKRGTGMGLAVVARIVSSHEGRTEVESKPGEGATFEVWLPVDGPTLGEEESDAQTGAGG